MKIKVTNLLITNLDDKLGMKCMLKFSWKMNLLGKISFLLRGGGLGVNLGCKIEQHKIPIIMISLIDDSNSDLRLKYRMIKQVLVRQTFLVETLFEAEDGGSTSIGGGSWWRSTVAGDLPADERRRKS